MVFRNHTY